MPSSCELFHSDIRLCSSSATTRKPATAPIGSPPAPGNHVVGVGATWRIASGKMDRMMGMGIGMRGAPGGESVTLLYPPGLCAVVNRSLT